MIENDSNFEHNHRVEVKTWRYGFETNGEISNEFSRGMRGLRKSCESMPIGNPF